MSDTNDRPAEQRRGPLGDARPNDDDPDPRTRGGQPAEDSDDRPSVGSVKAGDYTDKDRENSRVDR